MDTVVQTYRQRLEESEKEYLLELIYNYPETTETIFLEEADWRSQKIYLDELEKKNILTISDVDEGKVAKLNWDEINKLKKIWFTKEILECGNLVLHTDSFIVKYGKVEHRFNPGNNVYKFLLLLLQNKNKIVPHEVIFRKIFNEDFLHGDKEKVHQLMKDLKKVIGVPNPNKNIFKAGGGYMILD